MQEVKLLSFTFPFPFPVLISFKSFVIYSSPPTLLLCYSFFFFSFFFLQLSLVNFCVLHQFYWIARVPVCPLMCAALTRRYVFLLSSMHAGKNHVGRLHDFRLCMSSPSSSCSSWCRDFFCPFSCSHSLFAQGREES